MEKLEFEKVVTHEEFLKINDDNKNSLFTMASIELSKYKISNPYATVNTINPRNVIGTGFYKSLSNIEREFMISSIAYEDERIIKTLIDSNILFEHLEALCNNLASYKKVYDAKTNDNTFESNNFKQILNIVNKICFIINFKTGIQDDYLVINKLMYLVACKKELYLKLEKQKTKKPQ